MKRRFVLAICMVVTSLYVNATLPAYADRGEGEEEESMPPANDPLYKEECSSCHFLYLPGFLPARSWQEIVKNNDKHFGENLALDAEAASQISSYLAANSAERSGSEWSGKILRSVGSKTPGRITEVPWILKEHRKISKETFKKPSIGSFSNCGACHPNGALGDFEKASVPK